MKNEHIAQLCDDLKHYIHNEAISIEKTINRGESYCSKIFDKPVVLDARMEEMEWRKLWGRKGVYVFIIDEPIELSSKQVHAWNQVSGAGFKDSRAISIIEGECLYLGCCVSKSLYVRMGEHYSAKGTFTALKLRHLSRDVLLESVHVTAFPIMKEYSDNQYRILLPLIEKELHNLLVPLAGSSRV